MKKSRNLREMVDEVLGRSLSSGGFAERPGAAYRPDSTAWAVLALSAIGHPDLRTIDSARNSLVASQGEDGRVVLSNDSPDTIWPTPLAALAWMNSSTHLRPLQSAVGFILENSGRLKPKPDPSTGAVNGSIRGWPWVENTFSWVQPTCFSLLALKAAGHDGHPRAREAISFLLDRQLPHGGWNYGNTVLYGSELYPQPDVTGIALAATSGSVEKSEIDRSISYLRNEVKILRTPLSLAWSIIGLASWGERPRESENWIRKSLGLQKKYGSYGTSILSLLLLAFSVKQDPLSFLGKGDFR